MNLKNFFVGRTIGLIVLLIIVGTIAGFLALNNYIYKEKQGGSETFVPYRGTFTGVQTCLPHKDTTGPQTLECAICIKTDSGEYYALDFNLMSQIPIKIQNGERFTASGIVTPIENLNTNQWGKYNVQGIFSVTDLVQIEGKVEAPVFIWKYEKDDSFNLDGNPKTNVFLEAKYSNGEIQNKLIDTTPGGCNDLPDADKDSVPNSTNIQCYYAGLGYRYKITKGEKLYLVERKTFEEASPNYKPPFNEYKVISEFPLNIK